MSLTWAQFKADIGTRLHQYNNVALALPLIAVYTKDGVDDLQRSVEYYQTGHKDVLNSGAFTIQGFASVGALPNGKILGARMVKYDTVNSALLVNVFRSLRQVGWNTFPAMCGGEVNSHMGLIALDPVNRQYAVTPYINSETRLVLEWNGVKTTFADGDLTPFDSNAAEAISVFIKSKLAIDIDRDRGLAAGFKQDYAALKRGLVSEQRWNAIVDEDVKSQLDGDTTFTATSDGGQENPLFVYKAGITSLTGGGPSSLDGQVTAVGVGDNTVYFMVIGGVPQYWRLETREDAENVSNGFVWPDDRDSLTNPRVWTQIL